MTDLSIIPTQHNNLTPTQRAIHEADKLRRLKFFKPKPPIYFRPVVVEPEIQELQPAKAAPAVVELPLPPMISSAIATSNLKKRVGFIKRVVAKEFGLTVETMLSVSQKHPIAHPRQVGMYLAKEILKKSYPRTARWFGRKDHTTALWAEKSVRNRMNKSPEYAERVQKLRAHIEREFAK